MLKHINNRSDFAIVVNFYGCDGSPKAIPAGPFKMIFSTSGGDITYEIESTDTESCRKINPTTLSVFFDFSKHKYFRNGELLATFVFAEKNPLFRNKTVTTQIPIRTGYIIWDGKSDDCGALTIDLVAKYQTKTVIPITNNPMRIPYDENYYPQVLVVDAEGNEVECDVTYPEDHLLVVSWNGDIFEGYIIF